jgi:hypothetical protein
MAPILQARSWSLRSLQAHYWNSSISVWEVMLAHVTIVALATS